MLYVFNFKETIFGTVAIEAYKTPTEDEVIEAIRRGDADFETTDYQINLSHTEGRSLKRYRNKEI